jgi:CAAX amino terminal protease family.
MNKRITITGVNLVFLIFAGIFILYQLVAAVLLGSDFFTSNIYLVVLINEFVIVLPPVIIYASAKKADFKETFRLKKIKPLHALFVVLLSIASYPVAMMLNNIAVFFLQFIGKIPTQPIPIPTNIPELLIGILVIAVSPAICEEMLHRGLLLSAYERRGSIKAVVITAIFFGIFHFDMTNLLGPIFLGVMIGYYVIRTNSIFAGMIAHFTNNALSEIAQYATTDKNIPKYITISSQELGQVILIGVTGLVITGLLLTVFNRMTERTAVINPPISKVRRDLTSILSHWPVILVILLYFVLSLLSIMSFAMYKYMG